MTQEYGTPQKHTPDEQTTEQVKTKVQQATADVQAKADEATTQVKQKVSEISADVKRQASTMLNDVEDQAVDMAETRKEQAAGRLHDVAGALRQSSQAFRQREDDAFAGYTDMAADQVEHFANYLEERNALDLWRGVQGFARNQPEIFIAGSLAAGFFLGRFLKSTQESQSHTPSSDSGYGDVGTSRYQTSAYQAGNYPSGQYAAGQNPSGRYSSTTDASRSQDSAMDQRDSTYREPQEVQIGATAYNGERTQSGATALGTGATGSKSDWSAGYDVPELSNPAQSTAVKSAEKITGDNAERKGE